MLPTPFFQNDIRDSINGSFFSFSLPTREPTPLAMVVFASVATLLSVSVHISGFAF